ncbi:YdcF family protein [Paenibacillus qinlingensis]|uniref:Uncharacterized SAM-binding protein YcdF (DUF218 family) n=1 Tax=Paenibacillus qinlingensis TaxID=1837343 RepID=A0ABU1P2J4_9BACL|nr:YdcF family protein [Paenibacillus qinlingensis]MDR6553442.1 uncharacterized SAM-binding protein YcdF (DUF218 family) [Paenibacillus qinlingensis]
MLQWLIAAMITVIGLMVIAPLAYFVWMHTARLRGRDADALIVLGYRCDDNQIHPLLKERLDTTLMLFRTYKFRYIILSGGAVKSSTTEAEIMCDYLLSQGVPEDRMILESRSRNTVHNLVNCKLMMQQHGITTCVLVSNSFHIRRMNYIMKALQIPADLYAERNWPNFVPTQWKLTFREIHNYKMTLPWIKEALSMDTPHMMGKETSRMSQ